MNATSDGLECTGYDNSDIARLNDYCHAASELEVTVLLSFDGCDGLQTVFDDCIKAATNDQTATDACANCLVWEGVTMDPYSCKFVRYFMLDQYSIICRSKTLLSFIFFSAPTTSPTKEPTDTPSSIPSESPSISVNPSISTVPSAAPFGVLPAFYGYEYVGQGICQGDSLFLVETYDYLEYGAAQSSYDCPYKCAPYRSASSFRGFEFSSSSCRCLFDAGTDLTAMVNDNGGDTPSNTDSTNGARGTIVDVVGDNDVECYKKLETIVGPEEVTSFEYAGFGQCLSSSSLKYDFIRRSIGDNEFAVECGAACVDAGYTITAGVYTLTDEEYVDTGKTLTFDSHAECQVWARDAQADDHSDKVHDHRNAAGDVQYDDVNRVFTWTEYGPELDAGTVEGLCLNKENGVTKTIGETYYYQDKANLFLKIINIVTNDDTDFDAIRGFWVKDGESCYCLFDDEATVDGQTMNDPASGGGGTGLISSSDYTEGHCYKFDGQVEAVTTSEAPSLSSSPSSQPSTNPSSSCEPSSIPSESPSISANPTTPICSQTIADEIGCDLILGECGQAFFVIPLLII